MHAHQTGECLGSGLRGETRARSASAASEENARCRDGACQAGRAVRGAGQGDAGRRAEGNDGALVPSARAIGKRFARVTRQRGKRWLARACLARDRSRQTVQRPSAADSARIARSRTGYGSRRHAELLGAPTTSSRLTPRAKALVLILLANARRVDVVHAAGGLHERRGGDQPGELVHGEQASGHAAETGRARVPVTEDGVEDLVRIAAFAQMRTPSSDVPRSGDARRSASARSRSPWSSPASPHASSSSPNCRA